LGRVTDFELWEHELWDEPIYLQLVTEYGDPHIEAANP
jgi:hypothetical protein